VFLLEFNILLVESVDSVNHGLDKLDLGVSETVLVGNVIGVAGVTTRFTTGSTGLKSKLLTPGLQSGGSLLGPSGQVNVDRSAHAGSQVGGARVDVAELGAQQEVLAGLGLDGVTDGLDTAGETLENSLDVTAGLHGDDAELILLVDPDQEGLGFVVEDATAFGPVTLHTCDLQVWISGHEEEVVVDQLLADLLVHAGKRVVVSGKITGQLGESAGGQLLNIDTLLLRDAGGESESLDGATNTDPDGVNGDLGVDVSVDLVHVHVGGVLEVSGQSVVLADEGVEDVSEVDVRVFISGVDAAVLVVELDSAGDGLGQGELRSLADNTAQLVPFLFGDMLGDQAVLRLDIWEFCHGCFVRTDLSAQS
jgi:hypothetical protein